VLSLHKRRLSNLNPPPKTKRACLEKTKFGKNKRVQFIDIFESIGTIIVERVENDYSASSERVELAQVRSWMIGFTEYGLLSTFEMEIGYCDRIRSEDYSYLG
jgi:hypothetical protein